MLVFLGGAQDAHAAGSQDLWPSGAAGNRANSEWRTNSYGGGLLIRRTLVKAFVQSGEVLLLGSSAIGQGSSDILVWNPGLVTGAIGGEDVSAAPSFSCNAQRTGAQGQITSRAQELLGPDTIPAGGVAGGYVPCYFAAAATGVYDIAFVGPSGFSGNTDGTVAANLGSPGQLTNIQGGVSFDRPSFPLFFEPPSPTTIAALGIPASPTAPVMTGLVFLGNLSGNTSLVNNGGTFAYTSNVSGVYEIVISRDGVNFDPTNPSNRVLRGVRPAGAQTVAWDGKDNSGVFFPVGTYQVHARFHGGEYHFPMIDVENDTAGGPTITLLNPPGGTCPLVAGCTSAFYDDRAYMTLNGTVVNAGNTVGNVLCGNNPPTTTFADPINGFNTSSTQRAFGAASGGNANVPCDPTGSFGDTQGLDTWTFFPSSTVLAPLNIVAAAADVGLTKTVSDPTPAVGTNVTFTVTAHNGGPNATTALQVNDLVPSGLTFVSATPSQGTYNAGTGVWDVGALASGAGATLQLRVTVNGTTPVTNTATRSSSTPVDPNPSNDSASTVVTGSTVPGLPNNGVLPLTSLWPVGAALIILVSAFAARRVRRQTTRPR